MTLNPEQWWVCPACRRENAVTELRCAGCGIDWAESEQRYPWSRHGAYAATHPDRGRDQVPWFEERIAEPEADGAIDFATVFGVIAVVAGIFTFNPLETANPDIGRRTWPVVVAVFGVSAVLCVAGMSVGWWRHRRAAAKRRASDGEGRR